MQEIPFSVSGVIRINKDSVSITVNGMETTVSLTGVTGSWRRLSLEPGKTTYDVILEAARDVIRQKGFNRFTAAELYAAAREKYPELKRNSFMSRIVASTPNHPSYKHYNSRRDYFSHIGPGLYWLNEKYMQGKSSDKDILQNQNKLSADQ